MNMTLQRQNIFHSLCTELNWKTEMIRLYVDLYLDKVLSC